VTAYYDFTLGNSSPIPITITGAWATPTGPVIAVREMKFFSGLGNAGGRARSSIALKRGEDIHVRMALQLRACLAHRRGVRSSIPRIGLHYTALGRPGTTTLVPPAASSSAAHKRSGRGGPQGKPLTWTPTERKGFEPSVYPCGHTAVSDHRVQPLGHRSADVPERI
jgi:hypothetical protein